MCACAGMCTGEQGLYFGKCERMVVRSSMLCGYTRQLYRVKRCLVGFGNVFFLHLFVMQVLLALMVDFTNLISSNAL